MAATAQIVFFIGILLAVATLEHTHPLAALGYFAGIAVYIVQYNLFHG